VSTCLGGWVYRPDQVAQWVGDPLNRSPVFSASAYKLRGTGAGKEAYLYRDIIRAVGSFKIRTQKLGNCVSKGWGSATDNVDILTRARLGLPQQKSRIAAAPYYGFSRYEVGWLENKARLRGDGSVGAWAARAAIKYGCLRQQRYGQYDLTTDDDDTLSKRWGDSGVPDAIEPKARELLVQHAALVTSWEDVADAVCNRKLVIVCCDIGFSSRRDQHGFIRRGAPWGHCWYIIAVRNHGPRPGALLVNSWGPDWCTGPLPDDEPPGCAWIHPEDVHNCVRIQQDSYAIASVTGLDEDPWVMV
jgi:hypothetical protein